MLKPYIQKVINQQNLSAEEAESAMGIIMSGEASDAQIGGYLVALRMKGETVPEITGSARAMRAHAARRCIARKWTTVARSGQHAVA